MCAAFVLTVILPLACGAGDGPAAPSLSLIRLAPADSTLWIGQSVQLRMSAQDSKGAPATPAGVTWTVSNSTVAQVSASGVVTGVSSGTVTITARSGTVSGTAVLLVRERPVGVVNVRLELPASQFEIAQSMDFKATPLDADNQPLSNKTVTWSSSNPDVVSVLPNGFFTAMAAGTAIVTATSDGKRADATLTIVAPTVQPGPYPHEPAGLSLLAERNFSSIVETGWYTQSTSNMYVQEDPTAPKSPSFVMVQRYPSGFEAGASPAIVERGVDGLITTLYVSYWTKVSSNWVGHSSAVNKQMHLWIGGSNRLYTLNRGSGNEPLSAEIALQGVTAGGNFDNGHTGNLAPNLVQRARVARGEWQRWELVLKANTAGVSDGTIEWWINGVKVGSYTGIQFTSTSSRWEGMQWSPTWGGTGGALPVEQFMSLDHVYISGR